MAVISGCKENIQLLLSRGAKLEASIEFPVPGNYTKSGTALQYAAEYSGLDVIKLLLESGANTDALGLGPALLSPLHAAIMRDSREVVELLLASGANIEGLDLEGATPLLRAITQRKPEMVRLLLESGANPTATVPKYGTPLQVARGKGDPVMINLLMPAVNGTKEDIAKAEKQSLISGAVKPASII
jgi:ankyrin repeat protein